MDDQQHSAGSGQHPRPFFYVQPPSQPYPYHQQWHMPPNPFLYGPPGGYNFARPYLAPYQYMPTYPGFVLPPSQMHPMDYRRMFEPRYHLPPAGDIPYRHQHYQPPYPPQPHHHTHREVSCSEAQTDTSDAIAKLIECLGKLKAGDRDGREKELDSGVASQSSGIFSPGEEKGDGGVGGGGGSASREGSDSKSPPAVMLSDSTAAVYDAESSRRSLEELGRLGCWNVGVSDEEEDMPLDSSSVHEEMREDAPQKALGNNVERSKTEASSDKHSDGSDVCRRDTDELLKWIVDTSTRLPDSPSSPERKTCKGVTTGDKFSKADSRTGSPDEADDELSNRILKLPFEKVLSGGGGRPKSICSSGRLSSPVSPYYYPYLRTMSSSSARERMSVLSPSLDELSSRDEMFSTDFEDVVDLFPRRSYPSRTLLAEIAGRAPPGSKKFLCACCGTSIAKGTTPSKSYEDDDEAVDSDEERGSDGGRERPSSTRVFARKHGVPRKGHSLSQRHASQHRCCKRSQRQESSSNAANQQGRSELCQGEMAEDVDHEVTDGGSQSRTCCQDRPCRDHVTSTDHVADHGRWEYSDVKPKRRLQTSLQRQEMLRKVSCKPVGYHRQRDKDDDDEHDGDDDEPTFHRERGSSRGEPRC